MTIIINGPGVGLQLPQYLYPTELYQAPYDAATNYITLPPGVELPLPAGRNWVQAGSVGVIQYLDPVSGVWRGFESSRSQPDIMVCDGFTRRVANLTGCAIAAVVAGGGSAFAQSTATITANVGGSTWTPIVGGSLSVSSVTVVGANYSMQPIVLIPAPGNPGVQATAYATIASGTVSGVTLANVGAGYLSAPTAVILPNPTDPNFGSITQATVTLVLTAANAAKITAVLCTNPGAPLATISAITLTAAGGSGTGATITPVVMQTVTSASVVAGGGGFTGGACMTTVGGVPASVSAITNPIIELTGYRPRPANILLAASSGALVSVSAIYDGGLFVGSPTAVVTPLAGILHTTSASITALMGSANDTLVIQPL